jgi:hypothetical protein
MTDEHAAPLSAAEAKAIRARLGNTRRGPWDVATDGTWNIYIRGSEGMFEDEDEPCYVVSGTTTMYGCQDDGEAAFIAAARTDIPRLLATLDAYRAERDAYREVVVWVASDPMDSPCVGCGGTGIFEDVTHTAGCPVTRARMLLSRTES